MKNVVILSIALLVATLNAEAIKVRFTVANMSVNVAEGSIGIFTSFQIYPNSYINPDTTNAAGIIDFPTINYNDIVEVVIEKIVLNGQSDPIFSKLVGFPITTNVTYGKNNDEDFVQGNTYAYRLAIITNSGQFNLIQKSTSTEIAQPIMNCAKLNNVYRKACHNCFQESIVAPSAGGFYQALFYTRVVELDIWAKSGGAGTWDVRHNPLSGGSDNNCGYGTTGDNTFIFCLNDINNWHTQYPNHDPIILHVDLSGNFDSNHTPEMLDDRLKLILGIQNIYKPRDFLGTNFGDMRRTAHRNNFPSMGDLTGKFIIVMTGDGSKVSEYIADRQLSAVAFSAAKVGNLAEVILLPSIWPGLKNDIVFYNMQQFCSVPFNAGCGSDADFNLGYTTSSLNYINRTYGIDFWGDPGDYNNSEYTHAVNFNMNNIAVANITSTFNTTSHPENGIQWMPAVTFPGIASDTITSTYANVTQAATQNIVATNLIVETGTHYRMIAGNSIDLKPGVDFQPGSDVDVRIDDCGNADYTLRQANTKQLSQEEIDALMHELNKELYGYAPEDENEVVRLAVYPNPTNNKVNISYINYLLKETRFTLYDLTGRVVETKTYFPQIKGLQNFSIDMGQLEEGTYFYTLQVGEQNYNGKVVKTK